MQTRAPFAVSVFDEFGVVVDASEEIGILDDDQHGVVIHEGGQCFGTCFEVG